MVDEADFDGQPLYFADVTRLPKPASGELDRRRRVWLAISDLFLDTQLDETALRQIARTLHASGYTLEELDCIYWREVGPAVGSNAMSMAGVWDGFDETWLINTILKRQRSWRRRFPSINGYFGCRAMRPKWEQVKRYLTEQ